MKCCICGENTKKDMGIITRKKGIRHMLCTFHFNWYLLESNKIIEKAIRENKILLK